MVVTGSLRRYCMGNEESKKNKAGVGSNSPWLASWIRVILFYFAGFSLFFIIGFTIISIRVSSKDHVRVPDVVGKLYLDEHNTLQDAGFKIEVEKKTVYEYPYGYVIAQSEPSGKLLKRGAKLILLVNYSKNIIPVPQVVGMQEKIAEDILSQIPVGSNTFILTKGVVTRIPSSKPKGEILAQYPPAGTTVIPEFPVSLLISSGKLKKGRKQKISSLKGLHIEIIRQMAYHLKIPVLVESKLTDDFKKEGLVEEFDLGKKGSYVYEKNMSSNQVNDNKATEGESSWSVKVNQYKSEWNERFPNRYVWVKPHKKLMSGENVTMAEEVIDDQSGEVSYRNSSYLVFNDEIPVFLNKKMNLVFWKGYQKIIFDEIPEEAKVLNQEDAKPVFQTDEESKKEEIPEPMFKVSLSSIKI